jgi:hypothetical protein
LRQAPPKVEHINGLRLHLVTGYQDPLHDIWNDLILAHDSCGDAPLVGAQYSI